LLSVLLRWLRVLLRLLSVLLQLLNVWRRSAIVARRRLGVRPGSIRVLRCCGHVSP
jgi:hypothetical protein